MSDPTVTREWCARCVTNPDPHGEGRARWLVRADMGPLFAADPARGQRWRELLSHDEEPCVGVGYDVRSGAALPGAILYAYSGRTDDPRVVLDVWVRPEMRGLGVGSYLLEHVASLNATANNAPGGVLVPFDRSAPLDFGPGRGHEFYDWAERRGCRRGDGLVRLDAIGARVLWLVGQMYAPFRPAFVPRPEWLTNDVRGIAVAPHAQLCGPVLADALQDAGCELATLLRGLRGGGAGYAMRWVYQRARAATPVGLDVVKKP